MKIEVNIPESQKKYYEKFIKEQAGVEIEEAMKNTWKSYLQQVGNKLEKDYTDFLEEKIE